MIMEPQTRVPFPLGRISKPRAVIVHPADKPKLITLNRYPGQVIGIGIRLPSKRLYPHHRALSIMWAKPDRWW